MKNSNIDSIQSIVDKKKIIRRSIRKKLTTLSKGFEWIQNLNLPRTKLKLLAKRKFIINIKAW